MSYEPPEYGRYNPGPVFRADGTHVKFRIYDGAYLPGEPILDWRRKPKWCKPWEGTREEAEGLCQLLNKEREVLGKPVQSEMTVTSKSQRIWRAHRARTTRTASTSGKGSVPGKSLAGNVVTSLFVACEKCGTMMGGGEHTCQ